MPKVAIQKLLQTQMSRKEFLAFSAFAVATVFAVAGLAREIISRAATGAAAAEPELGSTANGVTVVNDSLASGGKAVQFGAATSAFILNTTMPNETNTGVPAGTTMTTLTKAMAAANNWGVFQVHSSTGLELFVPNAGVTISRVIIPWIVNITKANVTFEFCEFKGPQGIAGGSSPIAAQNPQLGLVICSSSGTLITQCDVNPTTPYSGSTGIIGHHYRAYRCRLKHVTDYFNAFNTGGSTLRSDVVIEGCYGTQIAFFMDDPYHPNDQFPASHNDAIQWQGNYGLKAHGNHFRQVWSPRAQTPSDVKDKDADGFWICNTAFGGARIFTCTPITGPCGDADIQYNWGFAGVTYALAITGSVQSSSPGLGIFANNRDLGHHRGNGIAYASTMPWNTDWPANQAAGYKFTDTTHGNLLVADNGTTAPSVIAIQNS